MKQTYEPAVCSVYTVLRLLIRKCAALAPPSHPCEVLMPFSIYPFRRFHVCCPVTYHVGLREGYGTVWNLSVNGWRLSGDVPLQGRWTRWP